MMVQHGTLANCHDVSFNMERGILLLGSPWHGTLRFKHLLGSFAFRG